MITKILGKLRKIYSDLKNCFCFYFHYEKYNLQVKKVPLTLILVGATNEYCECHLFSKRRRPVSK